MMSETYVTYRLWDGCMAPNNLESGTHLVGSRVSSVTVDRGALLALAEELEEDACWEVQSPGDDNRAWMLKDVCDRIREACGEVVDP